MKIKDITTKIAEFEEQIKQLEKSIDSLKQIMASSIVAEGLKISVEITEMKLKQVKQEFDDYLNQDVLIGRDIANLKSSYANADLWDK